MRWAIPYTECLAPIVLLGNRSAFISMRPLPREGVGGFTIAPTQRLKPPLGLKPLGQGVDAHTHGEACLTEPYRPWGVSNTKATCPLIFGTRRPHLKRGLLPQRRIVLRVSRNA